MIPRRDKHSKTPGKTHETVSNDAPNQSFKFSIFCEAFLQIATNSVPDSVPASADKTTISLIKGEKVLVLWQVANECAANAVLLRFIVLWYNFRMSETLPTIDRVLEPVAACLTREVAQRITEVKLDAPTMARLEELREKANEGSLNAAERSEYEEFVEAYDLLVLLKNKAKAVLQQGGNG